MNEHVELKPVYINHVANWCKQRVEKNKNAIIVLNGQTGSGKSWAGLALGEDIAEELGTNFTVDGNVSFGFADLLRKTMRPENQKPGTVFLFEEVGAVGGGGSSRDWQSKSNKFFVSWAQTTRHRNQILIFTTPLLSYLDKAARDLVHMQLLMASIDLKKKMGVTVPYLLQVNSRSGKTYFKKMRVKHKGRKIRLDSQNIKKPSEPVLVAYEDMKTKFTTDLYKMILEEEDKIKEKKSGKEKSFIEDYPRNLEKAKGLLEKGYSNVGVADLLGVSTNTIVKYKHDLGLL